MSKLIKRIKNGIKNEQGVRKVHVEAREATKTNQGEALTRDLIQKYVSPAVAYIVQRA